jgi:hypothetical protein
VLFSTGGPPFALLYCDPAKASIYTPEICESIVKAVRASNYDEYDYFSHVEAIEALTKSHREDVSDSDDGKSIG